MKTQLALLGTIAFVLLGFGKIQADEIEPVIQNVVERLKQDVTVMKQYGAHQRVVTTKLSDKGTPERIEEKQLRTIWRNDRAQNELMSVQCKEYDSRSPKGRRCYGVEKAAYKKASKKSDKPGRIEGEIKKIDWTDLHKNFEFSMLPQEGPYHVIFFRPSSTQRDPQNRIEKLLSRLTGKIWIDRQFNVVKAEAKLADTVSFGLGVAAKVHQLNIRYQQQPEDSVWLPASLSVEFKAKVALVHTERQRIEVFWSEPYRQSDTVWAKAGTWGSTKARR